MDIRNQPLLKVTASVAAMAFLFAGLSAADDGQAVNNEPAGVERLKVEAQSIMPLTHTGIAKQFLEAVPLLPNIETRKLHRDLVGGQWYNDAQAQSLTDEQRKNIQTRDCDETMYYYTKYGTPLAYVRTLDLIGDKVQTLRGKKVLDFGCGTIGHMRLMAACGADVTGIDVDAFLSVLYSQPEDQGEIAGRGDIKGHVRLITGRFSDESVRNDVGGGYDIITSKNTLKRGYVHPPPEEKVDQRMLVDLGVSDEAFVKTMYDLLNPGGIFIIYNLCPKTAPPGQPYKPWADGRCPFDRALLENVGFRVIRYDATDHDAARQMGHALRWDEGEYPMDLQNDLFATLTIVERPE